MLDEQDPFNFLQGALARPIRRLVTELTGCRIVALDEHRRPVTVAMPATEGAEKHNP